MTPVDERAPAGVEIARFGANLVEILRSLSGNSVIF